MTDVLLIVGMMVVTFVPRMLPLLMASRVRLPASVELALNYVPIAVLTIIITQTVFFQQGVFNTTPSNPYLWASVTAMFIAVIQKRLIVTIASGLFVFALCKYLLGA